jgi:hypothetical protein
VRPTTATLTTLVLAAAACAHGGPPPEPVAAPVAEPPPARVDTVRVEVAPPEMADMERRIAVLQLQLLEKDAQNRRLADQLNETRLEVVRTMAKLQSQATRAEAASGVAEAEIALQALAGVEGGPDSREYAEARNLLTQGTQQFEAGNFGGALYLATYARAAAANGQSRIAGADGHELLSGESVFALPVRLATSSRSNVRNGPGLEFSVRFVVEAGTPLSGLSYSGEWVRVVDPEGRGGWIFSTLVDSRR